MDPQTQAMLSEILMLTRDNNEMLHKVARDQKWAKMFRYLYWGLILLSIFGSYFFIQPLINLYTGGATSGTSTQDLLKGLDPAELQKSLNSFNQLSQ